MLLNSRLSKELPGTDAAGHPIDPVHYTEAIVIPMAKEIDLNLASSHKGRHLPEALGLFSRLRDGVADLSIKGNRREAIRLYADTHRAIFHIPHPGLRACLNKCASEGYIRMWLAGPRSSRGHYG
jgi:hypothetical protein